MDKQILSQIINDIEGALSPSSNPEVDDIADRQGDQVPDNEIWVEYLGQTLCITVTPA